jgi:hypothetical protein
VLQYTPDMGKVHQEIGPVLAEWIRKQRMFFVATAPVASDGLINCSPKGLDSFRILGRREVAYMDLTGSGVETIAHVQENGRIVFMFCGFEGPPQIVRLHGRGVVTMPGDAAYDLLRAQFPDHAGARAIIRATIDRVSDSCGYAVPRYEYVEQRDTLTRWSEKKGAAGLAAYRLEKNGRSIEGLAGLADRRAAP